MPVPAEDKPPTTPAFPQHLEEWEDATKDLLHRGKRKAKRAQQKVKDAGKYVLGTVATDEEKAVRAIGAKTQGARKLENQGNPLGVAKGKTIVPKEKAKVTTLARQSEQHQQQVLPQADPPSPSRAAIKTPSISSASNDGLRTQMILAIYSAVVAVYHIWASKSAILSNQFPLSVFLPCIAVAFLLGYIMDSFISSRDLKNGDNPDDVSEGEVDGTTRRITHLHKTGGYNNVHNTNQEQEIMDEDSCSDGSHYFSRTKKLVRRANVHLQKHFKPHSPLHGRSESEDDHKASKREGFWTSIQHSKVKSFEKKLMAPFAEGPLMDHLLEYSDFSRHSSAKEEKEEDETPFRTEDVNEEGIEADGQGGGQGTDTHMGKVKLNNTKAESLGVDRKFSHIVKPMCELRGMDLFLTDVPEKKIWRQPLLKDCGLRDTPTLVSNMMLPFGNMTAYFQLPDWVDDLNNIPKETDEDASEVKALKRFLVGDDEYRNSRAKLIPYVVDGPLAIRLIKPKPMEVLINGLRHPTTWENVQRSTEVSSGKLLHPLLEVDIDLISDSAFRKVINIVRPHLHSITIDLAFIISQPQESVIEEPSACLGLWRIDKVDFESCAVLPEKSIDEVAEELKSYMRATLMEDDKDFLEAAVATRKIDI